MRPCQLCQPSLSPPDSNRASGKHLQPSVFLGVEKIMSQPSGKPIYIPPYSGVRLIECRDHFQLVPVPAVRVIYGYGKIRSCEARIDPDDDKSEPIWDNLPPDTEVWAVMQWYKYEDGHQEHGDICFLHPECIEEDVRKRMERMEQSSAITREEALGLLQCYDAPQDDHDYVED